MPAQLGAKPRGFPRTRPSQEMPSSVTKAAPNKVVAEAPKRNKAARGFAAAQWEDLDEDDFKGMKTTTTSQQQKVASSDQPVMSAATAAHYAKKYVSGNVTVNGCSNLLNHTTSVSQIQTNPYVLVYADASREDTTPKVILQTPHMKNTLAPTFDAVSSTADFTLLSTSSLVVQVWHHSINKTFRTKGKGTEEEDLFIGEAKILAATISTWLEALDDPTTSSQRMERSERSPLTKRQESEEEFIVHHANGGMSDTKREAVVAPTDLSSFSFRRSKFVHSVTLPLKARQKEKDAAAKAASSKGELGTIELTFSPASALPSFGLNPSLLQKGKQQTALGPRDTKIDGYVTLLHCYNLLGRDVVTLKSDPYVVVYYPSIAHPVFRTETQTGTLCPSWTNCESIPVDLDNADAELIFDVWNENPLPEKDNFLGRAVIATKELSAAAANTEIKIPLAPRPKERDGDIARLTGRLGGVVIAWRASRGRGTGTSLPPRPSTSTEPSKVDAAAAGAKAPPKERTAAVIRERTPSQRAPSTNVTDQYETYRNSLSQETKGLRVRTPSAQASSQPEIINQDAEDVYYAPKLVTQQIGAEGDARSTYKASTPPPLKTEKGQSSSLEFSEKVPQLSPSALHSLMTTINTKDLNISELLSISKPIELPKHKSIYFTAEDYARYGARPPTANGASPYTPIDGQTSAPPQSSPPTTGGYQPTQYTPYIPTASELMKGAGANGAQGMPPSGYGQVTALGGDNPAIAPGRVGSTNYPPISSAALTGSYSGTSFQPCSHTSFNGICDECYRYTHTAMPPADQVHAAPPVGTVIGETRTSVPLTMTTIVPIRLTADKIRAEKDHTFKSNITEHYMKMNIDEPNLKSILAAAEHYFNIHPSSAMLLYNGEQLNPLQSLRESGVLLLKGDGAIHIKVQMFKGQRVNVVIKISRALLGGSQFDSQQGQDPVAGKGGPNIFVPLGVDSEWTISDLKHMFSAHAKCPPMCHDPKNYHLYFRYNRLVENMKIDYYRLPNGCELEVKPKTSEVVREIQRGHLTQHRDVYATSSTHFKDDRAESEFHEEDVVGIPRRKTALDLRREKREGRGSVATSEKVPSARARSAATDDKTRTSKAGPLHTVTKSRKSEKASARDTHVLPLGVPRSGVPITPLGAPELALHTEQNITGHGTLPHHQVENERRERIGERNRIHTMALSGGGVATYSEHVQRPEWDDRRVSEPLAAGTGRLRPTSPNKALSSPTKRLNEEERTAAMDIRPSDWRSTLRTMGSKNIHVPMGLRPESKQAHDDNFSYSYTVRPLTNETKGNNVHNDRSPLKSTRGYPSHGEPIYGVTSDKAQPIYGNDYSPLSAHRHTEDLGRGATNILSAPYGDNVYGSSNFNPVNPTNYSPPTVYLQPAERPINHSSTNYPNRTFDQPNYTPQNTVYPPQAPQQGAFVHPYVASTEAARHVSDLQSTFNRISQEEFGGYHRLPIPGAPPSYNAYQPGL